MFLLMKATLGKPTFHLVHALLFHTEIQRIMNMNNLINMEPRQQMLIGRQLYMIPSGTYQRTHFYYGSCVFVCYRLWHKGVRPLSTCGEHQTWDDVSSTFILGTKGSGFLPWYGIYVSNMGSVSTDQMLWIHCEYVGLDNDQMYNLSVWRWSQPLYKGVQPSLTIIWIYV